MNLADIKTIAVMGAGTMGNGIAHVFARAGYKVILRDVEQRFLDRAGQVLRLKGSALMRRVTELG